MTDTLTQTKTDTVADLKAAVRDASRTERSLALEMDAMPAKLEKAVKQDVRRRAKAARSGEPLSAADEISEVSALRQRQKDLPLLIWSQKVHHASLEVELFSRQQADNEQKAREAKTGLAGQKETADEATRVFNKQYREYRGFVGGADRLSSARAEAEKRLENLEQEYPA